MATGKVKRFYLPEEYEERFERVIKKLKREGVDLDDPRRPGSMSRSKLIRHLIDKELATEPDRSTPAAIPA